MTETPRREGPQSAGRVHPVVERLGAYSWRFIGIGIVAWVALQILAALRIVIFPLVVAVFLTVVLATPARWLRGLGWRPLAATWAVFLAFLTSLALVAILIVPALAEEFGGLGPTVSEAVDDIKTWLVNDSPFDIERARLDDLEEQAADRLREVTSTSGGLILETAVLALEIVAGVILALVMTFFFLKDGERFQQWALRRIPEPHHQLARRAAARGWRTIGAYLRGSALLGIVEGTVIGVTLAVTGATLVAPVMVLTFIAAFVPFVGAVLAGLIAVAVALATAGPTSALIVAIVALAVQQFDNDLLAPVVFGKALDLHPLIILISVAAGGALAGVAGAFVAVPLTALVINVGNEILSEGGESRAVTEE